MNLYKYFNEPEQLDAHSTAPECVPALFFKEPRVPLVLANDQDDSPFKKAITRKFKEKEKYIAKDWRLACRYATSWLKDRFEPCEAGLLRAGIAEYDRYYLLEYALYAMKGRWPEAESILATSGFHACQYAIHVLKARFELAEPEILKIDPSTNKSYCLYYANRVLNARWPEAEQLIIENVDTAALGDLLEYIRKFHDGRWLEYEAAVYEHGEKIAPGRGVTLVGELMASIDHSKKLAEEIQLPNISS